MDTPPIPTRAQAAEFAAAIRETLRRGGGDTSPEAVRAVGLAYLFAEDSPGRLACTDQVREESAFAAWDRLLADL